MCDEREARVQDQAVSHNCLQLYICFLLSSFLEVSDSNSHQIYAFKDVVISKILES
ncbi:hypothetical protein E2C01_095446 [Portunus trituberculatus]|uniref:Uncharacterized protein n=1 Tax=Portunus trituberculatus TaxID=210409 RepID=A0A5B7JYV8_PORTR|nr:hypothetical protein [Portunus trituberculatus]